MERVLDLNGISVEQIVDVLFNPRLPGIFSLHGVMDEGYLGQLLQDVRRGNYRRASRNYRTARQSFSGFNTGEADDPRWKDDRCFPFLEAVHQDYQSLFHEVMGCAGMHDRPPVNSIGIYKYDEGEEGLTAHRDASQYVGMIGSLTIDGCAPFLVYQDRESLKPRCKIPTSPGTLVLTRAPRCPEEKCWRPVHAVGIIEKERTAILFRAKK